MRRTLSLVLFLSLPLSLSFSQSTASNSEARKELKAAYDQYSAALGRLDIPGVMALLDPNFTSRGPEGELITRAGQEATLRSTIGQVKRLGPFRTEIQSLRVDGDKILATVRTIGFHSSPSFLDPKIESEAFEDTLNEDTWVKTAAGLRLIRSVPLRGSISGNVTPVPSNKPNIPSPKLSTLASRVEAKDHSALETFWKEYTGKMPLVESIPGDESTKLVTFIYRGRPDTKKVSLGGGLPSDSEKPLTRLGDTDLWYISERIPNAARGTYAFATDGELREPKPVHFSATEPDLFNPHFFSYGSRFELPDAPLQPYTKERPGTAKGSLIRSTFKSGILKEERTYSVYTPPGFDPKGPPYGLVVIFDGEVYGDTGDTLVPTPTTLDNLLAEGKIPPMVLVLVDSESQELRNRDLTCSEAFSDFLAKELVPYVRANYNVSADPGRAVVGGSSFGGLCASFCGLTHPEVFGNILSQSGSYWFTADWRKTLGARYSAGTGLIIEQYASKPKLPLRFWMEVGKFESAALMLETNRHLRDVLQLKGYPVTYSEFYGGHDYLCWRGSLAEGLIALAGSQNH